MVGPFRELSRRSEFESLFCFLFLHASCSQTILAFSSLLHENKKKSSDKMLPPMGIEPRQPLILSPELSFRVFHKLYENANTGIFVFSA